MYIVHTKFFIPLVFTSSPDDIILWVISRDEIKKKLTNFLIPYKYVL